MTKGSFSRQASPSASSAASSSSSGLEKVPHPSRDFANYLPALQAALAAPTQHAQNLPTSSDLAFHRSLDRKLAKGLDATALRIVEIANRLAALVEPTEKAKANGKGKQRLVIEDADDLVEDFEQHVQETLDRLLERADVVLDLHTGRQKKAAIQVKDDALARKTMKPLAPDHTPTSNKLAASLMHARDIPKPQLAFSAPIDNYVAAGPSWPSLLPAKQHAMVPIGWTPAPGSADEQALARILGKAKTRLTSDTLSPYAYETIHLQYPNSLFATREAIPPAPFATTPFTFVETPEQLQTMVEKLQSAKEIAVDLEHNGFRSYGGLVCLIQISTREEDWVVDALALRSQLTEGKLGGVLVDPGIIKVLHGAESDIIWLQQNFGMFVVGLFDTYHATKVLEFPAHSLASLLSLYCDFTADKRYQTADWRIRPLPEEMMYYARTDTHYLLYVYDQLRNALLSRSGGNQDRIREVLDRSAATALQVYQIEEYNTETGNGVFGWRSLARKFFGIKTSGPKTEAARNTLMWGHGKVGLQVETVFRLVHEWRDRVARELDESTGYVLPNNQLLSLARWAPQNRAALLKAVGNGYPVVNERADELVEIILGARKDAEALWVQQQTVVVPDAADVSVAEPMAVDIETPASTESGAAIAVPPSTSLWEAVKAPIKTCSSLFGATTPSSSTVNPQPEAAKSSMFGATLDDKKAVDRKTGNEPFDAAYKNIVASLASSVAPPQIAASESVGPAPGANSGVAQPTATTPRDTVPTEPEQIPYVKPSERKSKLVPERDDIVVVGRQGKKRKKGKVAIEQATGSDSVEQTGDSDANASLPSTKKAKRLPVKPEEIPEFDYANEPNQLDTFPEDKSVKVKKQKKVKKPVVDTSNFRKPPQDPSMPQAGNRSMTFQK